jgi:hypothetical protein
VGSYGRQIFSLVDACQKVIGNVQTVVIQKIFKIGETKMKTESEKLDHYFEQVKDNLEGFAAPCQRLIILHASKGTSPREDFPNPDIAYGVGKLKKLFDGCKVSFRNKVLFKYLVEILPPLEAEHDKAAEEQRATDELLALKISTYTCEHRMCLKAKRILTMSANH